MMTTQHENRVLMICQVATRLERSAPDKFPIERSRILSYLSTLPDHVLTNYHARLTGENGSDAKQVQKQNVTR